jgi:hypothetical protein
MAKARRRHEGTSTRVVVDLTRIPDEEFAADKPLRIATVREGAVIAEQVVTPSEQKDPRRLEVELAMPPEEDDISGAHVIVAPAEDERNILGDKVARKFASGSGRIDAGTLYVSPNIYRWWRLCWFPRTYRISGRVVRHEGDCTHPVGAANVEIYDVDYCWWWYDEDIVATTTTDADGFFDVTFTWCVPLWCILDRIRTPIYVDPFLRDRLREIVATRFPWPPPPPPDGPWEWEEWLRSVGVDVPNPGRPLKGVEVQRTAGLVGAAEASMRAPQPAEPTATSQPLATTRMLQAKPSLRPSDLFGDLIFWPPCDDPCDWRPDIRLRVTQNQPGVGTVEIYRDAFWQIHWNLDSDLQNLSLEANEDALYADACRPDPLLGNCMLFERVGWFNVSTIYEPDVVPGASYGATPDRVARLGLTTSKDRAWCLRIGVHGDFGLAANVDYYQVQAAKWTAGDLAAWQVDHMHIPPDVSFAPISTDGALLGFSRTYAELVTSGIWWYYIWPSETFAPQTIGGIPSLYKSRRRFEQEYRDAHGGNDPAPDFASGWYWDTSAMTRLFDLDTSKLDDGLYSFRLIGYRQTGVDASGQPTLVPVNMGLAGGVCKRCGGAAAPLRPEILTLQLTNDPHVPVCNILSLKKNGVTEISECDIAVLDTTDELHVAFEASDVKGNLETYQVTLQRGYDVPANVFSLGGVSVSGTTPRGPDYLDALADPTTPATAPVWNGGTWTAEIPASAFAGLGGSCAYNLRLDAWDRQTDGWSAGVGWGAVLCEQNRAFTLILAADRELYCEQLGCAEFT